MAPLFLQWANGLKWPLLGQLGPPFDTWGPIKRLFTLARPGGGMISAQQRQSY